MIDRTVAIRISATLVFVLGAGLVLFAVSGGLPHAAAQSCDPCAELREACDIQFGVDMDNCPYEARDAQTASNGICWQTTRPGTKARVDCMARAADDYLRTYEVCTNRASRDYSACQRRARRVGC